MHFNATSAQWLLQWADQLLPLCLWRHTVHLCIRQRANLIQTTHFYMNCWQPWETSLNYPNWDFLIMSNTHVRLSLCSVAVQQFLPALLYSQLQFVDVRLQLLGWVHVELHQSLMKLIQQAVLQQLLHTHRTPRHCAAHTSCDLRSNQRSNMK